MDDKQIAFANALRKDGPKAFLTYQQTKELLLPLTAGYAWGEGTIRDLWKMGAPTPNSPMGTPQERRIILPGQLAKWLVDVMERQGHSLEAGAHTWAKMKGMSR